MSCLACETIGPGGLIVETPLWRVDHCIGPLGVGTLIVKPRRHVLHVGDLDAKESRELGPLLQRVAAAVAALSDPDQVYVTLWSHDGGAPAHIHFVVQPVSRDLMDASGLHGPRLQVATFDRGELPDSESAAAFADRARELLGS